MAKTSRAVVRTAVHKRIRRKVSGNTQHPRLAIYRSLNHIYAQVIDDERGVTLASASTNEKDLRGSTGGNHSCMADPRRSLLNPPAPPKMNSTKPFTS